MELSSGRQTLCPGWKTQSPSWHTHQRRAQILHFMSGSRVRTIISHTQHKLNACDAISAEVVTARRGIKLDMKQTAVLKPIMAKLMQMNKEGRLPPELPVWLNADLVNGTHHKHLKAYMSTLILPSFLPSFRNQSLIHHALLR